MNRSIWALCIAVLWPALLSGQTVRVEVDENLRIEPNGTVLATLLADAELKLVGQRDRWVQVELEGWIWANSVRADGGDDFDLVVAVGGGENLRAEPNGTRLARLRNGMLLEELERQANWVRVRRVAWVWSESVTVQPGTPPGSIRVDSGESLPALARTGDAGSALLAAPDGDTVGRLLPMVPIEVVGRDGNWARVRLEAWAWSPAFAALDSARLLRDFDPVALSENPQEFRGQLVEWDIQFIALDTAEKIRTDFYEGEPYILARIHGAENGFVYVAVPPDKLDQVRGLVPLQRVSITARIRTGWSRLLAAPVLDLLAIK